MTWQELEQLGRRYRFSPTLRKRTTKGSQVREYVHLNRWMADGSRSGRTATVYLCSLDRLARMTQDDVQAKLSKLPLGAQDILPLEVIHLPDGALELRRGGSQLVLYPGDVDYLRTVLTE